MTQEDGRISRDFVHAPDEHNILIIGSGYGGGVAAARLSRAGQKVTVLERGREVQAGQFPKDMMHGIKQMQVTLSRTGETYGTVDGLYDFRISDNVNAFIGCGLGGTSLINANVAIEADPRSLAHWPAPYNTPGALDPYYALAREMLGSTPYPADRTLPKLDAMAQVAKEMDLTLERPDINVTFEGGHNFAGVWQKPCVDCGDCVSGCNVGAKNTVDRTYLADAVKAGQGQTPADLYVGAEVKRLEQCEDGWRVSVWDVSEKVTRTLTAEMVILAAGTFGSTEILLRSQTEDLSFSKKLGHQFSTNGDVWAFGYNANIPDEKRVGIPNARKPIYGVGAGPHQDPDDPRRTPGPCITSVIKIGQDAPSLDQRLIIEEGVMPGPLAPLYAAFYPVLDALQGDYFRFGDANLRLKDFADLAHILETDPGAFVQTAYDGPVSRMMPFLVMNHDSGTGQLKLAGDRVCVSWPDAGRESAFTYSDIALRRAADAIQAEYIPMPLWEEAFDNRVMAVHPLGGCPMGDDAKCGVVSPKCEVFREDGGVHEGLYVMDGSVLPGAVGVNPHLTITAVAEYAVATLASDRNWVIADAPQAPDDQVPDDVIPTDLVPQLSAVVAALEWLRDEIKKGEDINWFLGPLWDQVYAALHDIIKVPDRDRFLAYAGTPRGLSIVVLPIVEQLHEVAKPLLDLMRDNALQKALTHLEDTLGDFSPNMEFEEDMVGHVSTIGLKEDGAQHDPYAVAARGAENFHLRATVRANTVRQILDPGGQHGKLTGSADWTDLKTGEMTAYTLVGTFKYLIMNDAEIECWNMVYEGTLTPKEKGGRTFRYRGMKTLQLREGSHWWTDLTELAFDIYDADAVIPTRTPIPMDAMVARGVIAVSLEGVIKQANNITFSYNEYSQKYAALQAYTKLESAVGKTPNPQVAKLTADLTWRGNAMAAALLAAKSFPKTTDVQDQLSNLYRAKTLGKMGILAMRTYGGFLSYMANFPAHAAPKAETTAILPPPQVYEPKIHKDGKPTDMTLRLTRYEGGKKGPVLVAAGFGAISSTFATPTVKTNLVQALYADGFDVWLLDYRGSGDLKASLSTFDMDDVATEDFPRAITEILTHRKDKTDVQVVVHCVGSLLFFMAMLAGEQRVRSVVSSQLGPHTIINWFKYAQADSHMSDYFLHGLPESMWPLVDMMDLGDPVSKAFKTGLAVVDPCSRGGETDISLDPPGPYDKPMSVDQALDGLLWKVPNFAPTVCNSPTCHRINFFFGPTYQHEQLNQATHNAIKDMFGRMSPAPFPQIARCFEVGHAVSASQDIDYMSRPDRVRMPVHFIVGAKNPLMVPECSLRTVDWLQQSNKDVAHYYSRKVYQGYGHIDCFIGRDAHQDIFPDILKHLNDTEDFTPEAVSDAPGG